VCRSIPNLKESSRPFQVECNETLFTGDESDEGTSNANITSDFSMVDEEIADAQRESAEAQDVAQPLPIPSSRIEAKRSESMLVGRVCIQDLGFFS
jgi:hypothetical protein